MGIGGAVLCSLALRAIHVLLRFDMLTADFLRWLAHAFLEGGAARDELHECPVVSVSAMGRFQKWELSSRDPPRATGD